MKRKYHMSKLNLSLQIHPKLNKLDQLIIVLKLIKIIFKIITIILVRVILNALNIKIVTESYIKH